VSLCCSSSRVFFLFLLTEDHKIRTYFNCAVHKWPKHFDIPPPPKKNKKFPWWELRDYPLQLMSPAHLIRGWCQVHVEFIQCASYQLLCEV
jgi:hypothetical protein